MDSGARRRRDRDLGRAALSTHRQGLRELLTQRRDDVGAPALGALVARSEELVDAVVVGVRRSDTGAPAADGDRFHLGSNAKAMTATLAGLAVERGALAWDTDAADVLPDVERRGATLLHLLSHSAGLEPYGEDQEIERVPFAADTPATERLLFSRWVLAEEPAFRAGSDHRYSNAGYCVASSMVETALGAAWEDLIVDEVFAPLEMDADIGWPAREDPDQPWGHYARDGELVPHDPDDAYQLAAPIRPAGDVNASLAGYARFLRAHLRGLRGEDGLLGHKTFRRLHTPVGGARTTEQGRAFHGYALGWGILDLDGARSSVHSGSADTFLAVVAVQPERDLAAAVVANAAGPDVEQGLGRTLRELLSAA